MKMTVRRSAAAFLATTGFVAGLCGVGNAAPTAAMPRSAAEATPYSLCDTSATHTSTTSKSAAWVRYQGPFHQINNTSSTTSATFSATSSGSRTATLSGTISGGINTAIATAKAEVSNSIAKTASWSTSLSVTVNVPAHKTVYAEIGSNTWTVAMKSWKYNGNCGQVTLSTGTLKAPTSVGWKTWNG